MLHRRSRNCETRFVAAFGRCGPGWIAVIAAALSLGGCSISERLPGFLDSDATGSIAAPRPEAPSFDPRDWAVAESALAKALAGAEEAAPTAWSNAETGRRGEFTAVAMWFERDGKPCRAFVARIVGDGAPKALQATGCPRDDGGVAVSGLSLWKGL